MQDSTALIKKTVLELATKRGSSKSICPSEAARAVGGKQWRSVMKKVHEVAQKLQDNGEIVLTQRGKAVESKSFTGPYRIKIARNTG